jgi:cytochrome P450
MPFSAGPRACSGRNLAYLEQQILIATLVHNYEWRFERDDYVLPLVERFNQNPGDMFVKVSRRTWD